MHVGLLVVLDCAHQAGVTSHRGTTLDGRDSKIDMPVIDTVEAAQQRMIHWLADVSQGTDAFPVLVRRPAHACRLYSNRDGLAGQPDPAELQLLTHPRTSLIGPFRI